RYYDPDVQTMPLERLRALQAERLARQLDRVWSVPVPFFRRKLEAAGLRRADLRGLGDLPLIPTTVKDDLRRSEEEHPPFGDYRGAPIEACVRLGASTGTSGRPTLILWTPKDLAVDHAASARGRWRWGLRPGMSLANAHPFGMNAGGWHFSHGVEMLGVLNVPAGPPCGDGERGNLVVTVLEKDNFLLRYDLEDVVRWNTKPCPCGETHRRLFYEGRVRDVVTVGGREILPIDVAFVLYEFPEVSRPSAEYQIVRASDALRLRVEYDPAGAVDPAALAGRLRERIRDRLGVPSDVDPVARRAS